MSAFFVALWVNAAIESKELSSESDFYLDWSLVDSPRTDIDET